MSAWLSDETWSRLDPRGAHLTRRERVVVAVAATVGALVLGVGITAARAGVFAPHVHAQYEELTAVPGSHRFSETIDLDATGTLDEQLIAVRSATRGIAVSAASRLPLRIAEGEVVSVRFDFKITDCTAASASNAIAMTLRFHRFWGAVSRTVTQHPDIDLPADPVRTACA